MEDLERYLDEIVEPTVKDFENNPCSVRHAFLACVAVFHGVDYLAYPNKNACGPRQQFGNRSPHFKLVDDVAHAFKHVVVGHPKNPRLKARDVVMRPPQPVFALDLSHWGDMAGGVTLASDRNVELLDAVRGARDFLREILRDPKLSATEK